MIHSDMVADADKQSAIDLFLGIGEAEAAAFLRHCPPSKRSYVQWFTSTFLKQDPGLDRALASATDIVQHDQNYWSE